jgi:hypothetical protein
VEVQVSGRLWKTLWMAAALTAAPAAAQLDEDLVSDRPDFSESAVTVSPGRFQLEAGYGFADADGESADEIGQALLRIGLVEGFELRVGLGSYIDAPSGSGWDGGSLGIKVALVENWQLRPAVALLIGTGTPYGDEEVVDDTWQPEGKVALGWELSESLSLGVNAGYARLSADGEHFDQAQWSASLGWSATDRLGVFGEYFGLSEERPDGDPGHYLDGGATWLIHDDLQLDAWLGAGVSDEAADWIGGVGIVARW